MKKYEFTGEGKNFLGITLHRIRAVHDFGNVKKGELGGWIEKEENLSQNGDCWVSGNAWVVGNARVSENARVKENAYVSENAMVNGDAIVRGSAVVKGNAFISGDAYIRKNAVITGNAIIEENACISKTEDYLVVGPIGSRNDFTTFYKNKDDGISVCCGCFSGTIEEFLNAVKKTHGDNKYAKEYIEIADFANKKIKRGGNTLLV